MSTCATADSLVKRIAIPLANFAGSAGSNSADLVLWMTNPSVLLNAMIAIVMQDAGGSAIGFGGSAVWQIYGAVPAIPAEKTGTQVLGPVFSSARALPDAFVVDDPTKLLKLVVHLASTDDDTAGSAWAVATWEGKDACLPGALRGELFALCDLRLDGGSNRTLRAGAGV